MGVWLSLKPSLLHSLSHTNNSRTLTLTHVHAYTHSLTHAHTHTLSLCVFGPNIIDTHFPQVHLIDLRAICASWLRIWHTSSPAPVLSFVCDTSTDTPWRCDTHNQQRQCVRTVSTRQAGKKTGRTKRWGEAKRNRIKEQESGNCGPATSHPQTYRFAKLHEQLGDH